ncbi:MAG: hypothetical protein H7308_03450 [Chthonomonadaceae bacterium]|nr:hypothetical protein [Chthonomonadaceae bacterium]
MIENKAPLAAILDYIVKWVDALEGMRRYKVEQNGGVFPTIGRAPCKKFALVYMPLLPLLTPEQIPRRQMKSQRCSMLQMRYDCPCAG